MECRLHGRQIPPHRIHFPVKPLSRPGNLHRRPDPEPVAIGAFEANLQIMPRAKAVRIVPIDERFRIDVVDHKVKVPVVVQVCVRRAVRKGGVAQAPVLRLVGERRPRFFPVDIPVDIIGYGRGRHLPNHVRRGQRFAPRARLPVRIHQRTPQEIKVRVVPQIAVRHEQVVSPVQIEIGQ